jgi:signal transduction histidine kinase
VKQSISQLLNYLTKLVTGSQSRAMADSDLRVRNFIKLCFAGGLCGFMAFGFGVLHNVPVTPSMMLLIGLTSAYFIFPAVLRFGIKLKTMTVVCFLWMELIIFVASINFGGFNSPALPWFVAVPILAYYYLRKNDRILVLGVLAVGLVVMAATDLYGYNYISSIDVELAPPIYLGSTLAALVFVGTITHVFTSLSRRSYRQMVLARNSAVQKQRQAEWANSAKTQFLASMSHELRTPLNAIIGFSDLLKNEMMGPIGNPKYSEYSSDIHDSASHLLALIDDILNCSQLEAHNIRISASLIEVPELCDQVLKQVLFRPEAGRLVIEKTYSDNLPLLSADTRLLKQIMTNILVNAMKFTPEGGRIDINVGVTEDDRICLSVTDTGVGIPESDLDAVRAPFAKSRHSRSITAEGAGLGLSIASELLELHQATLEIESKVSKGTTVTCTFPAWRTFVRPVAQKITKQVNCGPPDSSKQAA